MSKHTPGPWHIDEYMAGNNRETKACSIMCPNDNQVVCEIPDYCYHEEDVENNKANAHLIAAAPDLYEALKTIVTNLPNSEIELAYEVWGTTNTRIILQVIEMAKQALAKSEGRNPNE
jgi:hypothetical protein